MHLMVKSICLAVYSLFATFHIFLILELMNKFIKPILDQKYEDKGFSKFILFFLKIDAILIVTCIFKIMWRIFVK